MTTIQVSRWVYNRKGTRRTWERFPFPVEVDTSAGPRPEAGMPATDGRTWRIPPHKDRDARPCIGWAQEAPPAGALAALID